MAVDSSLLTLTIAVVTIAILAILVAANYLCQPKTPFGIAEGGLLFKENVKDFLWFSIREFFSLS